MRRGKVAGLFLCCVYLLVVAGLIASDLGCEGMFCGFGLIVAGAPWTLFFDSGPTWLYYLMGVAGIALNFVILFFIPGLLAEAFGSETPR